MQLDTFKLIWTNGKMPKLARNWYKTVKLSNGTLIPSSKNLEILSRERHRRV